MFNSETPKSEEYDTESRLLQLEQAMLVNIAALNAIFSTLTSKGIISIEELQTILTNEGISVIQKNKSKNNKSKDGDNNHPITYWGVPAEA